MWIIPSWEDSAPIDSFLLEVAPDGLHLRVQVPVHLYCGLVKQDQPRHL